MRKPVMERRKYLRVETPLSIRAISKSKKLHETTTKDISPLGLRFTIEAQDFNINEELELTIELPGTLNAVHTKAKVVWKKKMSTDDGAPIDIGCEFSRIEEDNKNTFLKYFCDLLYSQAKSISEREEVQFE
ncbi:MAG: PilZ domain-containing protein [Candidatus Omnitrophota bacterium]